MASASSCVRFLRSRIASASFGPPPNRMSYFWNWTSVDPKRMKSPMTWSLNPWSREIIEMTVMTPTTMPTTVSEERSLWSLIALRAKTTFSLIPSSRTRPSLLAAQRLDRRQVGGADRGYEPREETDTRGDTEAHDHQEQRDLGRERRQRGDGGRDPAAEEDADRPAHGRHQRRLEQELHQHVPFAGAERHAHPDLARPLGHGHQHDVR